jgi:type II secretory pathway pseudopilin PulG
VPLIPTSRAHLRGEQGFTLLAALGVMLVTSLLLAAAFAAANGDIHLSHRDTIEKQAYYAALAGIQEYQYQLQANPDYWQTCATPNSTVPQHSDEFYEVTLLTASSSKGATSCSTANPFGTMIESSGPTANTFRIKVTGCAGAKVLSACPSPNTSSSTTARRQIVATFKVIGFLNYVYFTNFEDEDPSLYNSQPSWKCNTYYGVRSSKCQAIEFTNGDEQNGPVHSNDAVLTCGANFGRKEHNPADAVEFYRGLQGGSCGSTYYTTSKSYEKGEELTPPPSDSSLEAYVEPAYRFAGVTHLELLGEREEIKVTTVENERKVTKEVKWPPNGLIYVESNGQGVCQFTYSQNSADTSAEAEDEEDCGNVYVKGSYKKSLTIGAEDDVIVNGNVYPTTVAGKLGTAPEGTATLGLIATEFVRVYHPCGESIGEPWIYAAILSTSHSWVVDNVNCDGELGKLHVYGAIAQDFRGIVRENNNGYLKDYKYDQRLATEEPPYFLSPLKAGWGISRETTP